MGIQKAGTSASNGNVPADAIAASLSHPKYRPDIDGLRAIAVLAVVAFHSFPGLLPGGFTGVDIFFVISGFLISQIIFENLQQGTFSFRTFYARRIKRIFPALTVVLLATLAVGTLLLVADEYRQLGKHLASGAGFVSNLTLWSEAGYFDVSGQSKPLLHLWSLGIEEQFYLIWPVTLWLAFKRKWNPTFVIGILLLVSFGINVWQVSIDPIATFYSPQTRFWELLCGALLAWSLTVRQAKVVTSFGHDVAKPLGRTLSNLCYVAGTLLIVTGLRFLNQGSQFPGVLALIPVLGAVLLIAAGANSWVNKRILSLRILVWIGRISFPIYLWHWPILSFGQIYFTGLPPIWFKLASLVLTFGLAWLTYKYVEHPIRFSVKNSKAKLAVLSTTLAALGIVGLVISQTDFSGTRTFHSVLIKRPGFENAIGSATTWFRGKGDWLFLGDAYDKTVSKLKLDLRPSPNDIADTHKAFAGVAQTASRFGIPTALIVAPDKPSIYPEYLPKGLTPSKKRYMDYYLDSLRTIPNLVVYDPTKDLLNAKKSEGLLYWMTDTHWNYKGAFLAFAGLEHELGIPEPSVSFRPGNKVPGDLLVIGNLKDFPLHSIDNWNFDILQSGQIQKSPIGNSVPGPFGPKEVVTNSRPMVGKTVWVVGDSFSELMRPFLNATFKEVRYLGSWQEQLAVLPTEIENAKHKPDLILIEHVERLF